MTIRHLKWAALLTGLGLTVWAVVSLGDPAYYDPETPIDYVASILAQVLFLAVAYTFFLWWRITPVRRSAPLILGAAVGFVLWSIGNLLEEIMRVEFGEWFFFVGAGLAFILTAIAGVVTLTSPDRWRWSGLILLGFFGALNLEDVPLLTPIPFLAFAYLIHIGVFDTETST